eukprot:gb/GFBE01027440.1/.p1 GENE.gb/GFBE01027440.1/~~gb/GFBE01027440.1/.p1  ORF type:complete len:244 (+),score=52.52 gb/GFBE01027440.1/:1-732(+)
MFAIAERNATPCFRRRTDSSDSPQSTGTPSSGSGQTDVSEDLEPASPAPQLLRPVEPTQDTDAKIAAFVDATVLAFSSRCAGISARGHTSLTHFSQERHLRDLVKKGLYSSEDLARQTITEKFQEKLAEAGPPGAFVELRLSKPAAGLFVWILTADWGAKPQQTPSSWTAAVTSAAHGTPEKQCCKCKEMAPAVALVPCGHSACPGCALQLVRLYCPCCHDEVTGITNTLKVAKKVLLDSLLK